MKRAARILAISLACTALAQSAPATVPLTISYQGVVVGPDGNPAAGPVDIQIGVWTDESGGTRVYAEEDAATALERVFADVKNFVVEHPDDANLRIVYASLEGPEVAIFHRGIISLVDGAGSIHLPDHFTALASPGSITAHLTPASVQSEGVAIAAIHAGRIDVAELRGAAGPTMSTSSSKPYAVDTSSTHRSSTPPIWRFPALRSIWLSDPAAQPKRDRVSSGARGRPWQGWSMR